jgi:hypothetical protein
MTTLEIVIIVLNIECLNMIKNGSEHVVCAHAPIVARSHTTTGCSQLKNNDVKYEPNPRVTSIRNNKFIR